METVKWKVEGMTCVNCAHTVTKFLENQGNKEVKANFLTGEVSFEIAPGVSEEKLSEGINALGYHVVEENGNGQTFQKKKTTRWFTNHKQRFLFCLVFTLPLMLHMVHPWIEVHWIMNPWVQLALCMPVYVVGMDFFGRSAFKSILNRQPNMNVLIAIGATAAFLYSLTGALLQLGEDYLFFETAAAIITLVFLGNYLEDSTIQATQRELNKLVKAQKVTANMIAFDENHQEIIFQVDNKDLRVGDLILIKTGEQVPADCKILWGEAMANEAIITGESTPVSKSKKDNLIGGSILDSGTVKAQVTADVHHSVLANIINLVKQAQTEKPPAQQLADKISAVFVPIVLVIALITFILNYILLKDEAFLKAFMRMIAVLVIACPCAMGLATPAAIAVGLGRAARKGILFRNAKSLESFKNIRRVVFDKTGTLTTGVFKISGFEVVNGRVSVEEFKKIVYSLEKYSNHPLAKAIAREWKTSDIKWKKIEEIKGLGMVATDQEGNEYKAGSWKILGEQPAGEKSHNIYVTCNGQLFGWIDVEDEIREEAAQIIQYLKSKNIESILLSGDTVQKTQILAEKLGIDRFYGQKSPEEKLSIIADLNAETPTAMVGDGINDAPALAKATVGISLSEASQVAVQTADVVLMNSGLKKLPEALGLGKHTFLTVKQNLFWAFFYNIFAIPVAAFGFLVPAFAALVMGLSDVVLAINSVRLFVKKVT